MKKMKRICTSCIVILMVFVMLLANGLPDLADEPITSWEESDSYYGSSADAYAAESLAYHGAFWNPGTDTWMYNFELCGTGAVRPDQGNPYGMYKATMDIKEVSPNTESISVWTNPDAKYLGSVPESSGSDPDYSDAQWVVDYGINALDLILPGTGWVWTTIQMLDAMRNTYDSYINTYQRQLRSWDYSLYTMDAGQFFFFIADVEPNETVYFTQEYDMEFTDVYSGRHIHLGPYTYEITSPGPGEGLSEGWNPGMMTAAEKDQYEIEEIPRDNLAKRGQELFVPQDTIDELMKTDVGTFYFSHSSGVKRMPMK